MSSSPAFEAWLGHDDDNRVVSLYLADYDSPKGEARELTKMLRQGLVIRGVRDRELAAKSWDRQISEADMAKVAFPPSYDAEDGPAAHIAEKLVTERRGATT